MPVPYSLEQYVNDLRAVTAKEADPVKITDLVPRHSDYDSLEGFG